MFSLRPHRTLDPSRILETLDESTTAAADEQDLSITTTWTEDNISALARSITRTPTDIEHESDLYHPIQDSDLDPHSPAFNPRTWAKAIVQLERSSTATNLIRKSGIAFQGLSVYGEKSDFAYQNTFGNAPLKLWSTLRAILTGVGRHRVSILDEVEGVLDTGEMLLVLGPPGSGCSTLLKSIAGETDATSVTENAMMNYRGISAQHMNKYFRGEAFYAAETDVHFPKLSVGDTLSFAARARAPRKAPGGITIKQYSQHLRDVVMAVFGISHTVNKRVGSDYVRGVSGGERKRVSIAEAALSGSPLQCWDNSTRGLDSANAIEFCKTLRASAELLDTTAVVAIYQVPQVAYELFDKVMVLYEGKQIFFGRTSEARPYFEDLGFHCPSRQTTPDFLTSMTKVGERMVTPGFQNSAPRTAGDFAKRWQVSATKQELSKQIAQYQKTYPIRQGHFQDFANSLRQQTQSQRSGSPYTLSYRQQVELCLWRGFRRLVGDPSLTITQLLGNFLMALILGSIFYDMQPNTETFYGRGSLLFFAVLLNAFGSALEILTLYDQRPIVEKQWRYALYHPSAEAIASMITDIPYKVTNAVVFNLTIYFMANLRRAPGPFFFLVLVSFISTFALSSIYRTIASMSRTMAQAMVPAGLLTLGLIMFTGFTIPVAYMRGWSRWMNYINPLAYAFEALMVNEFSGRDFQCSLIIPSGAGYGGVDAAQHTCAVPGSTLGSMTVQGEAYIASSFRYHSSHKWRNVGIILIFWIFFTASYLIASELIASKKSTGEVLLFRRGHSPAETAQLTKPDLEAAVAEKNLRLEPTRDSESTVDFKKRNSTFHWENLCYDIKIKGEPRRILNNVNGWVRPGTLTALMGSSGAGKTTLLDVLATRVTMGTVTGEMFVDGQNCGKSFQRQTGYVQQQDVHLATSTVREALNFSALLRQPRESPEAEKLAYVDEMIELLGMEDIAEAVIGTPGENGLNIEQRKRLTIGIELAAKPQLLIFFDEPTSGLDSQTAWSICDLLRKLTSKGQAVLCTIHQPSSMLFQQFDRLLLLAKGGKTVYFGEIGEGSSTLIGYFEKNGAQKCPPDANPAEWVVGLTGTTSEPLSSSIDWPKSWDASPEHMKVQIELKRLREIIPEPGPKRNADEREHNFAASFLTQWWLTQKRIAEQYWRSPSYLYSKAFLCILTSLYIGFSFFQASNSIQGLQNQMYSIFILMALFGQLSEQIMPQFVTQRALYEVRERPSKMYSWPAFMLSNILIEIPWNTLMAALIFVCWYYPTGWHQTVHPEHERGFLAFLFVWMFMLFTSTFSHLVVSGIPTAETAGNIANICYMLCTAFSGVVVTKASLPGFWLFMYRLSPFTYLIGGLLTTATGHAEIICADNEYSRFLTPLMVTCGEYMAPYITSHGGYLLDPLSTSECTFCPLSATDTYLAKLDLNYGDRWRNFGILWAYIIFNVAGAMAIYWLARVSKGKRS